MSASRPFKGLRPEYSMDQTAPTRLLILEDEVTDAELAVHRLERSGIRCLWKRVETRADFSLALHEFRPDIILSDYTLPGFDGLGALEIAQREVPETPFVFLSGTMGEELAIEALKRGAMDYVLKTNPARLPPAVRRALEQAEERRARRAAEERVQRLTRVLQLLSGVNAVVARTRERMDLLQEVCRLAIEVGGYNTAVVAMIEPGTRTARPVAWSGVANEAMDRLQFTIAERPEHDTSAIGAVLRSGEVFVYSPTSHACPATDTPAGPMQSSSRATVVLPLLVDGTPVGAFELTSGHSALLGDEELRMLREIAANVSFALQYLHKEDAVRFLSYFDPMTGLAKRSLLCERLAQLLARQVTPLPAPAVAVFDIKGLSAVNDSFGRHVGDALLQLVADRLRRRAERPELIGHLGGGTFAIVLNQYSADPDALHHLKDYFAQLFERPFTVEGRQIPVSVQSGLARYPEDGQEANVLVQNAEAALRHARESGEQYLRYRTGLSSELAQRLALEHRLRRALDAGQFVLYYQPKVNIVTGTIDGLEALLRWRDPERGLISPAQFLSVLESTGLVVPAGDWVLQQAIADGRRWRALGLREVRIAVNVSPIQLRERGFMERLLELLGDASGSGCGIDLEVTESTLMEESGLLVQRLRELRTLGVRIALDDFGTGYSSLGRLARLPVDTLKIDRSFTSRLPDDASAATLVSTIIGLARAFDLATVAEGVETAAQLDWLKEAGCHLVQGYLVGPPRPREDIETMLASEDQALMGRHRASSPST